MRKVLDFLSCIVRIQNNNKVDSNKVEHADRKYSLYLLETEINSIIEFIGYGTATVVVLGIICVFIWATLSAGYYTYQAAYPDMGHWAILIAGFVSFWIAGLLISIFS